jgi:hypothetical protein
MRLFTALSALGLAGGMVAAVAAPAGAAATSHHVNRLAHVPSTAIPALGIRPANSFQVINYHSGLCLGISGGRNDAPAVQWGCNGHADQSWHWGSQNSSFPGWFQLVNGNGSCLGISGGSLNQGAQAVGWSCLGSGHFDQYWAPVNASCSGYVPLANLNSGYVLGVAGNSLSQGANVVQWGYQGVCNNQFWFGL